MEKNESPQINPVELRQTCGIIMPISPIDGCSTEHWLEVQEIIKSAIAEAGLESNLVSDADEIGVIQGRIVQNIYNYPIVICDVSGKNPNVMFELGLRLAFDKPTLIIKDDKTDYSFDTSPIEHIAYPRDLRFSKILSFKEKLKTKLIATLKRAQEDGSYSPFLKNFGEFIVPKLEQKEVGFNEYVINSLNSIKDEIAKIKQPATKSTNKKINESRKLYLHTDEEKAAYLKDYLQRLISLGHNTELDLEETTFSYLTSWKNLGYTEEDLQRIFSKVVKEANFSPEHDSNQPSS